MHRRTFLTGVTAGVAAGAASLTAAAHRSRRRPPPTSAGLAAPMYRPLPVGAIRPAGWLHRQLQIQADGLTGHLDEFWPDVAQEPVVRRDGRGLGTCALLARRRHPARLATRAHRDAAAHHPVRGSHRHAPARRRLVRAVPDRCRGEALRHVGHPARQQGAGAVPRRDRRRARARRRGEEPAGDGRRDSTGRPSTTGAASAGSRG